MIAIQHFFHIGDPHYLRSMQLESELHLKPGAPVMLLHNLSATLVNGCQGVIDRADGEHLYVNMDNGQVVRVERVTRTKYCPDTLQALASRTQFPLEAAFMITIHKAQGILISNAVIWSELQFFFGLGHLGFILMY